MKYFITGIIVSLINFPIYFSSENPKIHRGNFLRFISETYAVGIKCSKHDGTIDQDCLAKTPKQKAVVSVIACGTGKDASTRRRVLQCKKLQRSRLDRTRTLSRARQRFAPIKRATAANKVALKNVTKAKKKSNRPSRLMVGGIRRKAVTRRPNIALPTWANGRVTRIRRTFRK